MKTLTLLHWWQLETDEGAFVRLGPDLWAKWMGESLEILQGDAAALEREFLMRSWDQMKELEIS